MKVFLEISIRAGSLERELLLVSLLELGIQAFQETEDFLQGYVEASRWTEENAQALELALTHILGPGAAGPIYRSIQEKNWNREWEESLSPIQIGSRLLVAPSWCQLPRESEGRLVLRIDPKMSFGTGYHESTRLCLKLMERFLRAGSDIVDVGTGTGILAIAGVKLGAAQALGLDIDLWAIQNARENVALNGLSHQVRISEESLQALPVSSADLVAANLTLNANIGFLERFHAILRPGGTLILAGLLAADRAQMEEALLAEGFRILEVLPENEWIAIAAGKAA